MTDYGMILEVLKSQNVRKRTRKGDYEKIEYKESFNKGRPEIDLPENDIAFIFTKNGRLRGIINYKM